MYITEKSSLVYKSQWMQVYEDSVIYNDGRMTKIIRSSTVVIQSKYTIGLR